MKVILPGVTYQPETDVGGGPDVRDEHVPEVVLGVGEGGRLELGESHQAGGVRAGLGLDRLTHHGEDNVPAGPGDGTVHPDPVDGLHLLEPEARQLLSKLVLVLLFNLRGPDTVLSLSNQLNNSVREYYRVLKYSKFKRCLYTSGVTTCVS